MEIFSNKNIFIYKERKDYILFSLLFLYTYMANFDFISFYIYLLVNDDLLKKNQI